MKTKEQLIAFIEKQKVAFITSVDKDGFPNMKAMLMPRKIDGNCFYFTTNTSSMRVSQYQQNEKASIYFLTKDVFAMKELCLSVQWRFWKMQKQNRISGGLVTACFIKKV